MARSGVVTEPRSESSFEYAGTNRVEDLCGKYDELIELWLKNEGRHLTNY